MSKDFTPAHTETVMIPEVIGKSVILIPDNEYRGNEWSLQLRNCGFRNPQTASSLVRCHTGWIDVDQTEYDHYQIGAMYP